MDTPIDIIKIINTNNANDDNDLEQWESLFTVDEDQNWSSHFGRQFGIFLAFLSIHLTYNKQPHPRYSPKGIKSSCFHKTLFTNDLCITTKS
jgi:hypothetical protein